MWFLLVIIAFMRHLQGFIGIKCVIRQFLASQELIVDLIFDWLEFLVEVQTEKNRKSTTKNRKKPKKTRKIPKKTERYRKFQIWDTGFFVFFCFFSVFFGLQPPPPLIITRANHSFIYERPVIAICVNSCGQFLWEVRRKHLKFKKYICESMY